MGYFELQALQNVAKPIPDIYIHLAQGCSQLAAHCYHQSHLESTHALVYTRQPTETSHEES